MSFRPGQRLVICMLDAPLKMGSGGRNTLYLCVQTGNPLDGVDDRFQPVLWEGPAPAKQTRSQLFRTKRDDSGSDASWRKKLIANPPIIKSSLKTSSPIFLLPAAPFDGLETVLQGLRRDAQASDRRGLLQGSGSRNGTEWNEFSCKRHSCSSLKLQGVEYAERTS